MFGESVAKRIKAREFHFKGCRNRQARPLDKETKKSFKQLCDALGGAATPGQVTKGPMAKDFIAEDDSRSFLTIMVTLVASTQVYSLSGIFTM